MFVVFLEFGLLFLSFFNLRMCYCTMWIIEKFATFATEFGHFFYPTYYTCAYYTLHQLELFVLEFNFNMNSCYLS